MSNSLENVKKIILILSGKGGVGKSTTAVNLSLSLSKLGCKVGLLDLDLCGPSIALMTGLEETSIYRNDKGWIPLTTTHNCEQFTPLSVMSIAFLLQGW